MPQTMGEQYAISFGWPSESAFDVSNAIPLSNNCKSLIFLKGFRVFKPMCTLWHVTF